ncbi:hypothetical protein H112_05855 [Trichophyton rubrum D6]|uniref:Uncharacterized protein n=2 Tax=Trichophyton rubrum TaxID=5551 RepID=F2SKT1_TRIRC|nr:uncharacterized protein TERG_03561 [Trichophyton rubrum CBS 118892]EZF16017.1 hypothetical protein H100_05870 [Trichophyton rubrum MR850]EZF40146.1 hypothetical protein H102_05839 [Trichophyton rubrum CBS 100081]EZF50779.1 hypothetical protein H103_05867 [Trichophyton rubrum CBS 288.86]EZF61375.1 hypothetical protein H104_05852 [Trichophyton rubrum CBS 289.86]EZF82691.1 hypothetical protein H110_05861 [Trichophyton rubrum MR1448]EZF93385.1 hypothetical protein H113_05908 [Trichophyton rubr
MGQKGLLPHVPKGSMSHLRSAATPKGSEAQRKDVEVAFWKLCGAGPRVTPDSSGSDSFQGIDIKSDISLGKPKMLNAVVFTDSNVEFPVECIYQGISHAD